MQIGVLGAGSWGTAVATITAGRNPTTLWARDVELARSIATEHENPRYLSGFSLPKRLHATSDMAEAVSEADILVVGVPSHGFRSVLEQAQPYVRPWIPVVSLTKGLEQDTLLRMTQVIKELFPGHPAATLTGPNLAREIMSGYAAASVIATEDLSVAAALQEVFQRGLFRVYMNHDVTGCEVGGALKNVIAIATGIAEGLGVGDNTRAMVIARGLAELTRVGVAMGGEPATFAGLAGMGDLIATCMSPLSRNRSVGEQLGRGRPLAEVLGEMPMVAEGVKTAGAVMRLAERYDLDLPIHREIHKVISGQIEASEAYRGLRVQPGHESDPG